MNVHVKPGKGVEISTTPEKSCTWFQSLITLDFPRQPLSWLVFINQICLVLNFIQMEENSVGTPVCDWNCLLIMTFVRFIPIVSSSNWIDIPVDAKHSAVCVSTVYPFYSGCTLDFFPQFSANTIKAATNCCVHTHIGSSSVRYVPAICTSSLIFFKSVCDSLHT